MSDDYRRRWRRLESRANLLDLEDHPEVRAHRRGLRGGRVVLIIAALSAIAFVLSLIFFCRGGQP